MAITREEVKRIAELARIALTAAEEDRFAGELSSVLAYVAELEKLDVRGVVAMAGGTPPHQYWCGGTDLMNVMRADETGDTDLEGKSAVILAAVPERAGDLVKVPSVF